MSTELTLQALRRVAAELSTIATQVGSLGQTIDQIAVQVSASSPNLGGQDYYTTQQAADLLGLSRSTVAALIARQELPSIKIGGNRRVPAEALRTYLKSLEDQS